jgi:ubiquinone/menaquinone biosynthesis C-methylase UbiE
MVDRWNFDERAHAGAEHLDPSYVAAYDRKSATDPSEDVAALLAHGVGASSTVVDLGAGTGTFALAVAPHCRRIVAVDVSPPMLAFLRGRIARAGVTNVECVEAGFLTYEHDGPLAAAVYSRNALHHLPDFWKAIALQRIARTLRPGGVLRLRDLIYDFAPRAAPATLAEWFERAETDPSRGYTREDFATHVRTEHSTFRWLLEPMLDVTGFDIIDAEFNGATYGCYTCTKRDTAA